MRNAIAMQSDVLGQPGDAKWRAIRGIFGDIDPRFVLSDQLGTWGNDQAFEMR